MTRLRTLVAASLTTGVAVVAIADAQTSPAPPAVAVTLAKGAAPVVTGAEALGTGPVTFKASTSFKGADGRDFTLVKVPAGTDPTAFQEQMRALDGDKPDAIEKLDLVASVAARRGHPETITAKLEPGSYLAVDTSGDNNKKYPSVVLNIGAAASGATWPAPKTVVGMHSYKFTLNRSLPRKGVVRFTNPSKTIHMAISFKVQNAAKARALTSALKHGGNPEKLFPKYVRGEGAGSEPISPGRSQDIRVSQSAGNYVFVCFWSSKASRQRPHFALGMVKAYAVK